MNLISPEVKMKIGGRTFVTKSEKEDRRKKVLQGETSTWIKCLSVIRSCKTIEQLVVAKRYLDLSKLTTNPHDKWFLLETEGEKRYSQLKK